MKKASLYFKFCVLLFVGFYWMSTLLVNLPNCYLKIQTTEYNDKFLEFFRQSWNFFAPPPRANNRLYFSYYNKEGRDTVLAYRYEVIESIVKAKQKKRPFNYKEEILDYTLNNALIDFVGGMGEVMDAAKVLHPNATDSLRYVITTKSIDKYLLENYPSSLIYNFGIRFGKEKNLSPEEYLMKFSIRQIPIKKFAKRNEKDTVSQEQLVYESNILKMDKQIINPLLSNN